MTAPKKRAFVIMPFDAELNEVYSDFIKPVLEAAGYEVKRGDDIVDQQNILRDIVESIHAAELVVADLTDLNANVFYELGIAHALQKRVVLLTQDLEQVPFDLRSYRMITYDVHFSRITKARHELATVAKGAFDDSIEFGNPISDFIPSQTVNSSIGLVTRSTHQVVEADSDTEDEGGWLDHINDLNDGLEQLTTILGEVTQSTQDIGEETNRQIEKVANIRREGGPKMLAKMRFTASEYGKRLASYGEELARSNDAYESVANTTHNSIEYVVTHGPLSDKESFSQLEKLLTTFDGVVEAAAGARENYVGMREITRTLEGNERQMTRAARIVGQEIDRLISNIDKTIASVRRAGEVGRSRLSAQVL